MRKHRYLKFRCMVGEAVRHVAVAPNGERAALLGWKAAASEQCDHRLHLVANNVRLLPLSLRRQSNPASCICP